MRTDYIKAKIDNRLLISNCKLHRDRDEIINHEYSKLA